VCLIVDNNVRDRVLVHSDDPEFGQLHNELFLGKNSKLKVVYGGKLAEEYRESRTVIHRLAQLVRAGRAVHCDDAQVNAEEERVEAAGLCSSDDPHVIALARVSRARLLCSEDQQLRSDFKNKSLVDEPRGKVYSRGSHARLIRTCCR